MGFPFFRLPFELRNMIYKEIFQTPCRGKGITPDPTYFRRGHTGKIASQTIKSGSGLLRSCQQAHNEGAAALYGSHVFSFDDTRYGTLTSNLGLGDYCKNCLAQRHFEGCILPRCDYVFMHNWLVTIGDQNRLRIRHLELRFSRSEFTAIQMAPLAGEMHEDFILMGGVFVKNALHLLASAHHLETIALSFQLPADSWNPSDRNSQKVNERGFVSLFRPEHHSYSKLSNDLKSALCSVKGIKRLHCADITTWDNLSYFVGQWNKIVDDANASLWEVRREMESGYTPREDREDPTFEVAAYVDQIKRSMQIWQEAQAAEAEEQARKLVTSQATSTSATSL